MAEIEMVSSIQCLPYEIISILLRQNTLSCLDVINFGKTCKLFYDLIRKDQILWKRKLETNLQIDVYNVLIKNNNGEWLKEAENYYCIKKNIIFDLNQMSSTYYSYNHDIVMQELKSYFKIALANNVNYYLTVAILCDIVKSGYKYLENNATNMLYSLTEIHYAKIVLQYLIHLFLVVKWGYMCKNNNTTPENVVNFFLQWVDTIHIHPDIFFEEKLNEMVVMVKNLLESTHPFKKASDLDCQKWSKYSIEKNMWSSENNKKVLSAAALVVYQQGRMNTTASINMDTLNIAKSIDTKYGNVTTVAAIYAAVTRRCGVRVDLITFPNHLFVEWRENFELDKSPSYIVNLATGELQKKRMCPFSEYNTMAVKYDPHALIQHLIKGFHENVASLRNWISENILSLWKLLETELNEHNPYKNFIRYLNVKLASDNFKHGLPPDMESFNIEFRELIWVLLDMNTYRTPIKRQIIPRRHDSQVKYSIGMVCYHLVYQYVCVIRGWDVTCTANADWQARMGIHTLKDGPNQPFYTVLSADYSERYVAQENLSVKKQPDRLRQLEDELAKEFSHFDGYSYVPNKEKAAEYPDDDKIRMFHQSRRLVVGVP